MISNKRYWAVGLLVLSAVTLAGCGRAPTPQPMPTPVATQPLAAAGPSSSGDTVVASGEVIPAHKAEMSFTTAGRVQTMTVEVDEEVQPGEVLATLETAEIEAQIVQAEAALAVSQASLAQVQAGARPEEIAAAQEALAAAQAGVSAARANLASAQAALAKLKAGPKPEELTAAKAAMEKATVALQLAQSEYDKIAWQDGIGATQQAVALQQASIEYESARADYEALARGAAAEEVDMARAAVEAARAQVDVAQAQAGQAKAQLDQLLAGPSAEAINVTEAQVQQAKAALEAVQVALDQATLQAPFAGTVAALEVSAGETVLPGQTVLALADLGHLQVETTDLSERDVDRVAVGQQATVYVEALGLEITGQVARIANQASKIGGDVVYTVVVELDEQPSDLRWGMSVDVGITTR